MIPAGDAFVDRKRVLEIALTVLVAIFLLLAAEGRYAMPFIWCGGRLQRWAGILGGAGILRWARGWIWAFLAVALLLNPILPVRMQRSQRQPIDVWLGLLLLGWS